MERFEKLRKIEFLEVRGDQGKIIKFSTFFQNPSKLVPLDSAQSQKKTVEKQEFNKKFGKSTIFKYFSYKSRVQRPYVQSTQKDIFFWFFLLFIGL